MKKIKKLKPYDYSIDKDGDLVLSEGFVIYEVEIPIDRITVLESELEGMTEPTNEELIEEGKMVHPYYIMGEELRQLKERL